MADLAPEATDRERVFSAWASRQTVFAAEFEMCGPERYPAAAA